MRLLSIATLALALLFSPLIAVASPAPAAAFAYFGEGNLGSLRLTSAPGDTFVVRGQRPDGSYAPVAGGEIPESGTLFVGVAAIGPHNDGLAQFQVEFHTGGGTVVVLATGPSDGDDWYWD